MYVLFCTCLCTILIYFFKPAYMNEFQVNLRVSKWMDDETIGSCLLLAVEKVVSSFLFYQLCCSELRVQTQVLPLFLPGVFLYKQNQLVS